jgi:hypothetical protein
MARQDLLPNDPKDEGVTSMTVNFIPEGYHTVTPYLGSGRMSNGELRACLHGRHNDLHTSYSTLSFARISRL